MNEIIMMLVRYLLLLGLYAGLCVLVHLPVRLLKYGQDKRYLHCRIIVLLCVFLVGTCNRLVLPFTLKLIDAIINFPVLYDFLNKMTPQRNYGLVYMMLVIMILNLLFLLLADVLVIVVRLLFRSDRFIGFEDRSLAYRLVHFPWILANRAYEQEEESSYYRVKEKSAVRFYWCRAIKRVFLILAVIETAAISIGVLTYLEPVTNAVFEGTLGWYMLPAAGYVLFEQLQYFLENRGEVVVSKFRSDNIMLQLKGHLRELVNIYEQYFGRSGVLIGKYLPDQIQISETGLNYNGLTNAQQSACSQPHVLTILSNQLKEAGVRTSRNYQNALICLLNGHSISIRDHMQGEILIYLCAYMNYFLAEGETFLFLCTDADRAEEVRRLVLLNMERLNKVCSVWRIGGIGEADNNENLNVLVCGFQDLVGHKLMSKRKDFFQNLKLVVIDQAATFCAYSNIHKDLIFSELARMSRNHQYVMVSDVESPALEASFANYLDQEIYPFKNTGAHSDAYIMIWAEEGRFKAQRVLKIGSELSEYMGVSMVLSLVAVKCQFPSVHVYGGYGKPLKTYQKAMSANMQEIRRFLKRNTDYAQSIHVNDYRDIMNKDNLDMMILHDDHYNLYHVLWSWLKYGGKRETLIHIVSPAYMLRDYFAANIEDLLHKDNDYAPLISWRSGLDRSRFQALLLQMSNTGMTDRELMEKSREYGWTYASVGELLQAALNEVIRGDRGAYNIYESFSFSEDDDFNMDTDQYETTITIHLMDKTVRAELVRQTSFAQLNQKAAEAVEIPVLQENLTNYYLRDQIVSINGTLRNIINVGDGVLYAENTTSETRNTYYQASEFELGGLTIFDQCVDLDLLDFNIYVADRVVRTIHGYWQSDRGIDLEDPAGMLLNRIYDRYRDKPEPIRVEKHNIQVMEIRIPTREMGDSAEQMILLLALMVEELCKTLFPDTWMNLFTLTEYDPDASYWEDLFENSTGADAEARIHSIIPFVRKGVEGRPADYVSMYILEFSSVELGMISGLYANRSRIFRILYEYLNWYIPYYSEGKGIGQKGFLHLGMNDIPEFFAAVELRDFCDRILPDLTEVGGDETENVVMNPRSICSFCGMPTVYWHDMSDGRRMCNECREQMITQEEEIRNLFDTVVRNMYEHYGVKIPTRIHLRFASADAIRQKTGVGNEYERVLGFCERKDRGRKKDLWIEARGPRNTVMSTLIHELTHYWQFEEIGLSVLRRYGPQKELLLEEGHASYVEVYAMREFGETDYADAMEAQLEKRKDEYGQGFLMMRRYMQEAEGAGSHKNPFEAFKDLVTKKAGDPDGEEVLS